MARRKKNWKDVYDIVGVKPGIIIFKKYGKIDLNRDDIPMDIAEALSLSSPYIRKKSEAPMPE